LIAARTNPAAIGLYKIPPGHFLFRRQKIQILFGKEHVPALVPATGGTTGTGKEKPITIKRLFCHYSRSLNFSPNPAGFGKASLYFLLYNHKKQHFARGAPGRLKDCGCLRMPDLETAPWTPLLTEF
jgi:hypothetical protein